MTHAQTESIFNLRQLAEDRTLAVEASALLSVSHEEALRTLHELQVHQIELEMQNELLRHTQHELEASHARYFDLYDLAPVGYCTLSKNGLILECNLTTATLLGVPRGALDNQPISRYILNKDQGIYDLILKQLFDTGEPQACDLRMVKMDGTIFWAHQKISVSQNPLLRPGLKSDVPSQYRLVLSNINWRKQAELELQKKNADIEQFLYTVSHDLRSPLVTVKTFMGYLEIDMLEDNREQLAEDIHYIQGAADKMKLLLDELVDLSRIGLVDTPPVRISLRKVIDEALEALAGIITERKVTIHLPDTDLVLFGDPPRMCQVWQNLIENAIMYSCDSSTTLVELGIQRTDGETVFSVRDNGIGIEPQYHSKIFGIFEKLNPKSPGAGMGLTLVQRIVDKCSGRVWVESEGNGKGACFYFTLPNAEVRG